MDMLAYTRPQKGTIDSGGGIKMYADNGVSLVQEAWYETNGKGWRYLWEKKCLELDVAYAIYLY